MNSDLANLIELQKADAEISRLNAEIASLPKKVAAIEQKLAGSKDRKQKAESALKADEMARRKHEGDIESQRQKISKYRDQMLNVKTNQEYAALGKEVEFAQQEIARFEDKILEIMMDVDNKNAEVKRADGDLKAQTAEVEKEKNSARDLSAKDEKELAEWKSKRDAIRGSVSADILSHYDRVLKRRGTAIAEAVGGRCSACQVLLRQQVYSELRSTDNFITCDSCSRILFYDPAHDNNPLPNKAANTEAEQADNATAQ